MIHSKQKEGLPADVGYRHAGDQEAEGGQQEVEPAHGHQPVLVRAVSAVRDPVPDEPRRDAEPVVTAPVAGRVVRAPAALRRVARHGEAGEAADGGRARARAQGAGGVRPPLPRGAVARQLGVEVTPAVLGPALVTPVLALRLPVTHLAS